MTERAIDQEKITRAFAKLINLLGQEPKELEADQKERKYKEGLIRAIREQTTYIPYYARRKEKRDGKSY